VGFDARGATSCRDKTLGLGTNLRTQRFVRALGGKFVNETLEPLEGNLVARDRRHFLLGLHLDVKQSG
jgi:hypothetical protein